MEPLGFFLQFHYLLNMSSNGTFIHYLLNLSTDGTFIIIEAKSFNLGWLNISLSVLFNKLIGSSRSDVHAGKRSTPENKGCSVCVRYLG